MKTLIATLLICFLAGPALAEKQDHPGPAQKAAAADARVAQLESQIATGPARKINRLSITLDAAKARAAALHAACGC